MRIKITRKMLGRRDNAFEGRHIKRNMQVVKRLTDGFKNDIEVTPDDCKRCNLILFGDPSSNIWIRKALKSMPIRWNKDTFQLGTAKYDSSHNSPALIAPSPFALDRYVVINSGHTFHETELNRLNYLLYPHQGDWAVFKVGDTQPSNPSDLLNEEVLQSGYFNESWK